MINLANVRYHSISHEQALYVDQPLQCLCVRTNGQRDSPVSYKDHDALQEAKVSSICMEDGVRVHV